MAIRQVSITIRSSDGTDDYSLSCNVEWSINRLKEIIQEVHPLKPEILNQKLFYQGTELQSNQVIDSFLKVSDALHVIELVVTKQETTITDRANSDFMDSTGLRRRNVGGAAPPPSTNPWLQQWQQNPSAAAYYQQYSYPQLPMSNENYAAMWQQYQQHINDYMNYCNTLAQGQTGVQTPISTPATQTDGANYPAPAPADPPPQGNVPEANPPMNAQGGFVAPDNDDLVANDWLDVLFALFRYAFFLSIIYFYSSLWRFLLVASFFFLMYIYQSGIFRAQRRPHHNEVERRDNAGEREPENTDDNNNDNAEGENAENETEEQEVPPPPSIFATAWCFITTFFSSLIPQPPPVV